MNYIKLIHKDMGEGLHTRELIKIQKTSMPPEPSPARILSHES